MILSFFMVGSGKFLKKPHPKELRNNFLYNTKSSRSILCVLIWNCHFWIIHVYHMAYVNLAYMYNILSIKGVNMKYFWVQMGFCTANFGFILINFFSNSIKMIQIFLVKRHHKICRYFFRIFKSHWYPRTFMIFSDHEWKTQIKSPILL